MIFGDDGYSNNSYSEGYENGIKHACREKDKELLVYETKYKEVISIILKDRDKYKEALQFVLLDAIKCEGVVMQYCITTDAIDKIKKALK